MKKLLFIFTLFITSASFAQDREQGQLMFTLGMDAYKTDNQPFDVFQKYQMAFEGHYFVADKLSIGLGLEWYAVSGGGSIKYLSFSPRWYPAGGFFLRMKPLIPLNKQRFDIGAGLGFDIPLGETWAFEIAADYYIDQAAGAARLGIAAFF